MILLNLRKKIMVWIELLRGIVKMFLNIDVKFKNIFIGLRFPEC